jgi:mRNA interferase MazF
MIRRGDIVLVAFPYTDGSRGKVRPAVVVQGDHNNKRLANTIVAMITGNTTRANREPAQFVIDPKNSEGKGTGLLGPSAVKCENLYTIVQDDIARTLGHLGPQLLKKLDASLRAALDLH